jgi:hypothetical protein
MYLKYLIPKLEALYASITTKYPKFTFETKQSSDKRSCVDVRLNVEDKTSDWLELDGSEDMDIVFSILSQKLR